jgi:hypothetical protein
VQVVMGSDPGGVGIFLLFHAAVILLFYIVQRVTVSELCIFGRSVTIPHCIALGSVLSDASAAPTSQVLVSAMPVLAIVRN